MFEVACMVDAGIGGRDNEDRALIGNKIIREGLYEGSFADSILVAVCDGVGGEAHGEVAAEMAASCFAELFEQYPDRSTIEGQIEEANRRVLLEARRRAEYAGMATTIVGAFFRGDGAVGFHVGDSRMYRYREPYVARLTRDHSIAEVCRSLGIPVRFGQEHVITHYLGGEKHSAEFYDGAESVFDGDLFLFCSDGISDVLTDEILCGVLAQKSSLTQLCRVLVEKAKSLGSQDNLSAILVRKGK